LAATIEKAKGVKATLEKSSGGVFEILKDGELVFSKKALGRFPNSDDEVLGKL
jgi:selT/selW/selH-like putative selenoprotein